MKPTAYGYPKRKVSEHGLVELSEVTLAGTPSELRRIAKFIALCADEIDRSGAGFGHSHLQDESDLKSGWDDSATDIIVVSRKSTPDEKNA
jgi:hypothetical protein